MDSQFQLYYGQSWETKAYLKQQVLNNSIAGVALPIRTTRYSFLDNLFIYNTTANQQFNIPYLEDFPSRPIGNTSTIWHTFYFDAYLPPSVSFGPTEQTLGKNISLPVVILLHGEVEDKGAWNANMTSQYLARLGFLVCDLNYGYLRTNNLGNNYTGYYLRDLVRHIGLFTQFLETHADYYHANLSSVFFGGRHLGGGLSLLAGLGYQSVFSSYFSSALKIKGLIPFYPVSDIGTDKTYFTTSVAYYGQNLINGSADPTAADYNADWMTLNPIRLLEQQNGTQIPIFFVTGTHDWIISIRYSEGFLNACRGRDVPLIYAPYLFGNDGFDGNHVSPYGQHVIYYLERFLFLNL